MKGLKIIIVLCTIYMILLSTLIWILISGWYI